MGGFFATPKPPKAAYVPPPAVVDPAVEDEKARKDMLARRARGRDGLTATSGRGLLAPSAGGGLPMLNGMSGYKTSLGG